MKALNISTSIVALFAVVGISIAADPPASNKTDPLSTRRTTTQAAQQPASNDADDADTEAAAEADAEADANNPDGKNEVHVHHHHHHYHHAPGDPAYYYSQPTGSANPMNTPYPQTPQNFGGGYGGGWGGWGGGGGTIAGNYLQGAGAYMQGAGAYNLNTAMAARQAEAARAAWLQNQMSSINDYFLARQANREYRKAEQAPPLTHDQIYEMEASRLPTRLTNEQFNPVTGAINWPDVLKVPALDPERQQLDKLFAERNPNDYGVGSENYHAIQIAVHSMTTKLHDAIKALGTEEYLAAIKFVDSLGFEARFPPSPPLARSVPSRNAPSSVPPAPATDK